MLFRRTTWTLLCGAALILALAACGDGSDAANGRIRILLSDSPFPLDMVESAVVTVSSVAVHLEDDGWQRFEIDPTPFNLLDLQNGVVMELADAEIPTGDIDQIRLVVDEGSIDLTDEREFNLKIPSGSASGLKIFPEPPIAVAANLTTEILLDIDVARSFLSIPASPQRIEDIESFHFKPVLRVANMTVSGSIAGHVMSTENTPETGDDLPLGAATVMATADGDTATALTDTLGFYRILGLDSGSWMLEAERIGFESDSTLVDVIGGNEAVADTLRLGGTQSGP